MEDNLVQLALALISVFGTIVTGLLGLLLYLLRKGHQMSQEERDLLVALGENVVRIKEDTARIEEGLRQERREWKEGLSTERDARRTLEERFNEHLVGHY